MESSSRAAAAGRVARFVNWLRHWPGRALLFAVVAVPVWAVLQPWVTQRTLTLDVSLTNSGPGWAIAWQRAADGQGNGVWLSLPQLDASADALPDSEPLEVRVLGDSAGGDTPVELWLYRVEPLSTRRNSNGTQRYAAPDLKQIIADKPSSDTDGRWVPFEGGEGIVFYGRRGALHLDAPPGGVRLHVARTPGSGRVSVRYANVEQTLDLHAPSTEYTNVVLERRQRSDGSTTIHVSQRLPHYRLGALTLHWESCATVAAAPTNVDIRNPALTERVFGIRLQRHELTPFASAGAVAVDGDNNAREFRLTAPDGEIALGRKLGFSATSKAIGYGLTLVGLAVLSWLVARAARVVPRCLAQPRTWPILAFLLVALIRLWMIAWAPFCYTWDSTEYLANAIQWLDTGTLGQFDAVRPPGYSMLLAALIAASPHPSFVFGLAHALLGLATTGLVYLTTRRLLPSPWPVIAVLVTGLDPTLLTYERYALTEVPAAFVMALLCWIATVLVALDASSVRGRWQALLCALALGLLSCAAVYVRSNFVVLIGLTPLILLINAVRTRRQGWFALLAPVVVVLLFVLLIPRAVWQSRLSKGQVETHRKRLEACWEYGKLDYNQVAVYSRENWRRRQADGTRGFAEYLQCMYELEGARALSPATRSLELALAEMYARRPLTALGMVASSCGYQMGLLVHNEPRSWVAENAYFSLPLRGRPTGINPKATNFEEYTRGAPAYATVAVRLPNLEIDVRGLEHSPAAAWFDRLFQTFGFIHPILAVAALLGVAFGLRSRSYGVLFVALMALGNMAVFVYLLTPTDRYGVPFRIALIPVALYGLRHCAHWIAHVRQRTGAEPALVGVED